MAKLYEEKQEEEPGFHYVLVIEYDAEGDTKKSQRISLTEKGLQEIRALQGSAESDLFVSGTFQFADMRSDIDIPALELTNAELDDVICVINILTGPNFPFRRFKGVEIVAGGAATLLNR